MSEELKPCPFCGGEAKIYSGPHYDGGHVTYWAVVKCESCEASGMKIDEYEPVSRVEEWASEAWNRRAEKCNRDELLDIADELESFSEREYCAYGIDEPTCNKLSSFSDRIREALGVES